MAQQRRTTKKTSTAHKKKSTTARKKTARKAPARKKATARKAPARKKTTARKATSTTARKKTARKAPARKKATARKVTSTTARKKTARKAPARKKTTARKATSTTARKKTTARKTTSTTARKKSTARKAPARKTSTARKTTAKKSTSLNSSTRTPKQVMDNARIPTLALEEYSPEVSAPAGVRDKTNGSTKIGWIGAGQCGGRLVKSFYDLGYHKVLAVNTAYHDLNDLDLPESQKILMDIGRKGAGKDMARGEEAAVRYRQEIIHSVEQIFSDNVDHLMVTFGAGGGTGSGSVMPLLDTIKSCAKHIGLTNSKKRLGVLCTLPTAGEAASPKVATNAHEVVAELTKMADNGEISPLIIVDNDKIQRMYPGLTVRNFWPTVNNTVSGLFDIFNRMSALSSPYTSFDSVDYQSILECGGCAIMGLTKVKSFRRKYDLSQAIKANLAKTVLADGFDLQTARVAGVVVVGGRKIFASVPGLQDSINHAFDVMTDLTGNATVHRGIFEDDKDSVRVYTIIGGLDAPGERIGELRTAA